MDKKSVGIVVAIGVILLGIIIAIFIYDGAVNTTIADVNGTKYDKSDFESYLKVWQYENGDTAIDMDEKFETYKVYKLYTQYTDLYDIELPSGEKVTELTDTEKIKVETEYNLSESEYMRVKTEIAEVDYLFNNLQDYWKVSDEEYKEHQAGNEDLFKTYDYRVMQVLVKDAEEKSGDVSGESLSGDVSGEVSGEVTVDNSEEARKNEAKSRAVEALAKVQSGDSFEEVAKEYGSSRIVYTPAGYSVINGTLESISGLYMEDYLWEENVIKALQTLEKGEYSEIYEGEGDYMFVYLEDIRDGLDKAESNLYKRQIANEHIQGEARIVGNKIVLRSIDLEKLIPALTKEVKESGDVNKDTQDNTNKETTSGDNNVSGEVKETVSGEIKLSGDVE